MPRKQKMSSLDNLIPTEALIIIHSLMSLLNFSNSDFPTELKSNSASSLTPPQCLLHVAGEVLLLKKSYYITIKLKTLKWLSGSLSKRPSLSMPPTPHTTLQESHTPLPHLLHSNHTNLLAIS